LFSAAARQPEVGTACDWERGHSRALQASI
jgi:hypothetical protein